MTREKIVVIPFCDKTPRFCSREFFKKIRFYKKKYKKSIVIFCFYASNLFRLTLSALIINKGKVESIFGEGFSKRQGDIRINGKMCKILFYYDVCPRFDTSFDMVIWIDDENVFRAEKCNISKKQDAKEIHITLTDSLEIKREGVRFDKSVYLSLQKSKRDKICTKEDEKRKKEEESWLKGKNDDADKLEESGEVKEKGDKKREIKTNKGEETEKELNYLIEKYKGRILFIFKNGEVLKPRNLPNRIKLKNIK